MTAPASGVLATIGEVLAFVRDNLPTIVLLAFVALLFFYLLKLHLDPKYANFDLAELVTRRDGSVDFEKLRVMVAFVAGAYGFFYLLVHDRAAFVTYGPWFLGLSLGHAIANRVTSKDGEQPTPTATPP